MKRIVISISTLAILLTSIFRVNTLEERMVQEALAGKVIRFHVLANSDTKDDQELKLKVRDEVGRYLQEKIKDMRSVEETEEYLKENIGNIEQVAKKTIEKQGKNYSVKAELCESDFPIKSYENCTFPEGKYEALKLVIGKGEGHNWWCVLYPNLCFSNALYKWNKKEWKRLKENLSPKEYYHIMDSKKFTIRWKFLEYFNKKG